MEIYGFRVNFQLAKNKNFKHYQFNSCQSLLSKFQVPIFFYQISVCRRKIIGLAWNSNVLLRAQILITPR